MIELPETPHPNGVAVSLIDFGLTLQPPLGGAELRVDRLGSRYRVEVSWPPMRLETARVFIARLQQAKSEGLRVPFPLVDVPQGSPGSPVVDGVGQSGTTIALRGLAPGYAIKEGYWLSIEDAAGQHYLHSVRTPLRVDASGQADVPVWPMLRTAFADGDAVHLAKPMIEGLPEGSETSWAIPVNRLVSLQVAIRETA